MLKIWQLNFFRVFLKKNGHQTDLIFDPRLFDNEALQFKTLARLFDIKKEIAYEVLKKKPDVIGFPVFTINYRHALDVAREIKKINPDIPIIFGGIHPTSCPDVVIKEKDVDIICIGEGEYALLELLDSLKKKKPRLDIKNLWFKDRGKVIKNPVRNLVPDLNTLPFPNKKLFYDIYPSFVRGDYYTVSSRGCPFACTYCANNVLQDVYCGKGKMMRQRTPQNLIDELIISKKTYHPKQITFADDVFVQDIEWLKIFTRLYRRKIKLPYTMLTHPRFITPEVAKLLADSGCFLLAFGIQSASEETRTKILKRFETNDQIRIAATSCHQAGLRFSIDHIFNIPGEALSQQEEALRFYNELRPSIINSYWLQYFPRTEIIKTALKYKIIKKNMVSDIENGRTSSSMVVGFGGHDTFNPDLIYTNFQFLFMLLPILPSSLVNRIIAKKYYLLPFKPPIVLNISIKFLLNIFQKRGYVYLDMIKSMVFFSSRNLSLKLKYLFSPYRA